MVDEIRESVKDHEKRLSELELKDMKNTLKLDLHEERFKNFDSKFDKLESKIETMILNEGNRQRDHHEELVNRLFSHIEQNTAIAETAVATEKEVQLQTLAYKKTRLERSSEIFLKAIGAGGAVYILLDAIIKTL